MKIAPSRNGKITLSFTIGGNHALVASFNVTNMSVNAIPENKIFAKISEFTVNAIPTFDFQSVIFNRLNVNQSKNILINFCVLTTESRVRIWYQSNAFKPPSGLGCCPL